ncbi:hypothetical protein CRG98_001090 [Punica granatum]|uniref:Uncharacterized protein n=1 Tax=Punica granatum TaxID=22663 RepID=A0A2I0LCY3_PUNGR|nr:hypothetical protein CRG98_001090 [Punica granatum]
MTTIGAPPARRLKMRQVSLNRAVRTKETVARSGRFTENRPYLGVAASGAEPQPWRGSFVPFA